MSITNASMEETTTSNKIPAPDIQPVDDVDAKIVHDQVVQAAHEHAEESEPHMPPPSLSPIILGAGMTLVAFGLIFGPIVLALGAIGVLVGLGTWLYDEIKNANASPPDHE